MKSLFRFIARFHVAFLFVMMEILCLTLLVQNNNYQKSVFLNSSNSIVGNLFSGYNSVREYLSLTKVNDNLNLENARLNNVLLHSSLSNADNYRLVNDSIYHQQYVYRSAKLIRVSVNKQLNYFSINKGSIHGIAKEMAVVSTKGLVGLVKNTSKHFSTIIPLINSHLKVSARIKKNNYYGSLSWDGLDYRKMKLHEIPSHVNINIGDTIITSGYSAIFPEGVLIGVVDDFVLASGGIFYDISVLLSVDYKQVSYVHVIGNLMKQERLNLEKQELND